MNTQLGNILFAVAGVLWGLELIPQLVKTYKSKQVGDFSPFFLALCLIAYTLFMIGCVLIGNWWLFFSHVLPVINVITMCIFYKLYHNRVTYEYEFEPIEIDHKKSKPVAYMCLNCNRILPNKEHKTKNGCLWCDTKGKK